MPSYVLRKIDPELWRKVKTKAASQTITLKDLFNKFMRDYVKQ